MPKDGGRVTRFGIGHGEFSEETNKPDPVANILSPMISNSSNRFKLLISLTITYNDFAPNSVWMRSCQGMGVEKVRKDDTARTFEFLFRFIGCG